MSTKARQRPVRECLILSWPDCQALDARDGDRSVDGAPESTGREMVFREQDDTIGVYVAVGQDRPRSAA
jgi:hypothetical protein